MRLKSFLLDAYNHSIYDKKRIRRVPSCSRKRSTKNDLDNTLVVPPISFLSGCLCQKFILEFRYFANTKNSFADEFVRLVRNRLCPDSSQLTQNFKNMSLDQSLVGECCFIAIRDSKKDKKQILNKIRYGVSKYFRKEVHRAKPNVLKWNCDEQNQITNRSTQLFW